MSQLTTTKNFAAGQRVTHTDLNQITSLATLNPTTYTGAMPGTDNLLFLRGATLGINSWSNITQNATSLTVKPISGFRYSWISGNGNFLLKQETNDPSEPLYPIHFINNAASNSLYLNGDGVGVLNSAPGCALDVTGTARATALITRGDYPFICLTDTDSSPVYYAGLYLDGHTFYIGKLVNESGAGVGGAWPFAVDINAEDNTLIIAGTGSAAKVGVGTISLTEKLNVGGNIAVDGSIVAENVTAGGAFYSGASAGIDAVLTFTGTLNGGGSGTRTLTFKKGILTGAT